MRLQYLPYIIWNQYRKKSFSLKHWNFYYGNSEKKSYMLKHSYNRQPWMCMEPLNLFLKNPINIKLYLFNNSFELQKTFLAQNWIFSPLIFSNIFLKIFFSVKLFNTLLLRKLIMHIFFITAEFLKWLNFKS